MFFSPKILNRCSIESEHNLCYLNSSSEKQAFLFRTDIQLNRFVCYLPGNIKKMSKKIEGDDEEVSRPTKKREPRTHHQL
mmetsp:Transcript_1189/g.1107  ORF Transcript_1189/g.1107 Transcript_1189/m.1107 type:complete len:80 (+) Transcript_1189:1047-1286(+)